MPWDRAFEPGPDKHLGLESDDFDLTSLPPDCVAIPLGNGGVTLVDEEDTCRVDEYNWYKKYAKMSRTWYAATTLFCDQKGKRTYVAMHRLLFGLTSEDRVDVDHKNHNGLDNRRSTNLRLASRSQNTTNCRPRKRPVPGYKGVHWSKECQKWHCKINCRVNGQQVFVYLGLYDVKEEAAYAYRVAARLVKDTDFLSLDAIPPDKMPSPSRKQEIGKIVVAMVKKRLSGAKSSTKCSSEYLGVCRDRRTGSFRVSCWDGKKLHDFGGFKDEREAAFAYDCAVLLMGLTSTKINNIPAESLENPGRAESIRSILAKRLEARKAGIKIRGDTSSRFWGVCKIKVKLKSKYLSYIRLNNNRTNLYYYDNEVLAAVAYNIAVSLLNNPRLKPNPIPAEEMPSPEVVEAIRVRVAGKLAKGLAE